MIERYDIGENQPTLDKQRAIGAVANLEDSLALVHSLIEKAVASGNLALANGLLQTLSKLSKEFELARERARLTLPKQVILQAALATADLVCDAFQSSLPEAEFNAVIDSILPQIAPLIEAVANQKPQLLLTHEEAQQ